MDVPPPVHSQPPAPPPPELRWSVHLAREQPTTALLAVLAIILVALALELLTGLRRWAIFATIVLCYAQRRFLLPFTMRMDHDGIFWPAGAPLRFAPWSTIRAIRIEERKATLSVAAPLPELADWRGGARVFSRPLLLTLYFGDGPREAIVGRLRENVVAVAAPTQLPAIRQPPKRT